MYYEFNAERLPHISYMNLYDGPDIYVHPRRISGEYIIFFIKNGTLDIKENDVYYHLTEGDMMILDPYSAHEGTCPGRDAHYYIHLRPETFMPFTPPENMTIHQFLENNRSLNYTVSPFSQEMYGRSRLILPKKMHISDSTVRNKFELAMEQAAFAAEHREDYYKLTCSSCFLQILIELAVCYSNSVLAVGSENFSKTQIQTLDALTAYLHKNFGKKLTGACLEAQFDMNFDYLNRLFKRKYGTPIFTYLNTLRINKSVEMLIAGNTKAYEIARTVGYNDEYYFSKAFKKQIGVSPKNYLKLRT